MSQGELERIVKALISLKGKMTESQRFEVVKVIYYAFDNGPGLMKFVEMCEIEDD